MGSAKTPNRGRRRWCATATMAFKRGQRPDEMLTLPVTLEDTKATGVPPTNSRSPSGLGREGSSSLAVGSALLRRPGRELRRCVVGLS